MPEPETQAEAEAEAGVEGGQQQQLQAAAARARTRTHIRVHTAASAALDVVGSRRFTTRPARRTGDRGGGRGGEWPGGEQAVGGVVAEEGGDATRMYDAHHVVPPGVR